jgi:hypothetical protein
MDSGSANPPAPVSDQPAADGAPAPGEGGDQRDELCRLLRAARERRSLTIEDIARVTRIPDHSLRRLEAGEFEDLPGDVFVRGFLRSYARCVGLDAADVLRRYAGCGMAPAPVASDHALAAAAEAAAMAERDDGAEVGRAVVGGGSGSGSGSATGSARGTGTGSARGSGTRAATAGVGKESVAAPTGAVTPPVTATGTGTGARAVKQPATTGVGQPARATTASRGKRQRQGRPGRAASQPAARRVVPREARRARSQRGGRWRPSMLAVAIAVLVIAAVAVMSHLLRRPDQRPRGGEASGSSSR